MAVRQTGNEAIMSGKRPSLADSMRQAVAAEAPPPSPAPAPTTPPRAIRPEPAERPTGFHAAIRVGKKKVTATLDPRAHKQLKSLANERETTVEALLNEAIADLFAKHGLSRSA